MEIKVSIGEVIDKITILSIKKDKITSDEKLNNIFLEYNYLVDMLYNKTKLSEKNDEYIKLYDINLELWDIEDKIRIKEKKKEFDGEFIELARSVYHLNDERAKIKKEININYNSEIIEEKSYEGH